VRLHNVPRLSAFVSAAQQDHQDRALPSEVDSIARAKINPQLLNTAAYGLAVSKVAQPDPIEAGADKPTARASLIETSQSEDEAVLPLR
jgi:hypothetical protein